MPLEARQPWPPALLVQGIAGLQYPPPGGVERLVGGLFLAGATCQRAWRLKLSLLAYWLVDGGFVQPRQLADEFRYPPRERSAAACLGSSRGTAAWVVLCVIACAPAQQLLMPVPPPQLLPQLHLCHPTATGVSLGAVCAAG